MESTKKKTNQSDNISYTSNYTFIGDFFALPIRERNLLSVDEPELPLDV